MSFRLSNSKTFLRSGNRANTWCRTRHGHLGLELTVVAYPQPAQSAGRGPRSGPS